MKLIVLFSFVFVSNLFYGQKLTQQQYVDKFSAIAMREQKRSGVPAAITLAQGVLESESGNSYLAKSGHNHFGIKCKTEWTGEKIYKDDDERNECFRKYNNDEESYVDHSDFLKNRPYYKECFTIDVKDYKAWATCLKKCGYATEKNYASSLTTLIEKLQLQQYTLKALEGGDKADVLIKNNDDKEISAKQIKDEAIKDSNEGIVIQEASLPSTAEVKNTKVGTYGKIIKINKCKAIMAYKNTPLLLIAQQQEIGLAKLKAYNDLENTDVVPEDQPIFLQPKRKYGANNTYTITKPESLQYISQKEGIQLASLLQLNNLTPTAQLKKGVVLNLDNPAVKKSFKEKVNRLFGK
jgi:LysM repeat protein